MHAPRLVAPLAPASTLPDSPAQAEQRYLWKSQWGTMLIEVVGGQVRVDGQLVEPFRGA